MVEEGKKDKLAEPQEPTWVFTYSVRAQPQHIKTGLHPRGTILALDNHQLDGPSSIVFQSSPSSSHYSAICMIKIGEMFEAETSDILLYHPPPPLSLS